LKEPSNDNSKVRFTNRLAVQVVISDPKKSGEYTETLSKAMEYVKENSSHPILSSKVFLPFGKSAAIDNDTFRKLISMQNEDPHHIKHAEMHNLCHIDNDISLDCDTTGERISSMICQILMDEVDVKGEPIFHSIERTIKKIPTGLYS
jgi:Fe-S-cluster formation regulator IscX/YfhJ